MTLLASLDGGQSFDRLFVQRAGGQPVNRFGRESDNLALGEGLNRLVDHVAQIVCVSKINHDDWHNDLSW